MPVAPALSGADCLAEMGAFYKKFKDDIEAVADMYLEKLESKISDHDESLHPGRYDRD